MNISKEKLTKICKKKGITLKDLLKKSGVSKTAYYNLLYNEKLLPKSIYFLADVLEVSPSAFLEETSPDERNILKLVKLIDEIVSDDPELDRENVRHTLLLLQEKPIERLKRGLIRGRRINFFR